MSRLLTTMNKEAIPETFESAEQAGEFWDTHSAADYADQMTEVEVVVDIRRGTYLVPVADRIYKLARRRAEDTHCSVEDVINKTLERELDRDSI